MRRISLLILLYSLSSLASAAPAPSAFLHSGRSRRVDVTCTDAATSRSKILNTSKKFSPHRRPSDAVAAIHVRGGSLSMVPSFDSGSLAHSTLIFTLTNALGAILSLVGKSQIHVDLLGTGSFALAALPALLAKGKEMSRVTLSAAAVVLWSAKLACYLLYRIIKLGEDTRLSDLFASTSGTISFWVFSLLWGVLCSLPHTLGTASSAPGNPTTTAIGMGVYAIGLIIETTSDYQKWMFKSSNPGKFCNVGLWSISQHPNWFGNLLIWLGILILNAPALIDVPPATSGSETAVVVDLWDTLWGYKKLLLACFSPIFMWFLFNGQAEGSLTTAVELAKGKYGGDPEYIKYIENVPKIIPKLF